MADLLRNRVERKNLREELGMKLGSRERLMRGISGARPVPGASPTPQLAQASIQQQAPGMVRRPGGPVEPQQEQKPDYLNVIAGLNLDERARKAGVDQMRLGILQVVMQNAPRGSAIGQVAGIFAAGIIGEQEAHALATKAAGKQITGDAIARSAENPGALLSGAAALSQLGDDEGAKLLFDRYDTGEQQKLDTAAQALAEAELDLERNDRLDDNQRADAQLKLNQFRAQLELRRINLAGQSGGSGGGGGGDSRGVPGITKLPVGVQRQVVGLKTTKSGLDALQAEVESFVEMGVFERAAAQGGLPGSDQAAFGRLQSLSSSLLIEVKELANLGVLAGPDVEIVTRIIGDATSVDALRRGPEFVQAKLAEARQWVGRKSSALNDTYGLNLEVPAPPPGSPPPQSAGDSALDDEVFKLFPQLGTKRDK